MLASCQYILNEQEDDREMTDGLFYNILIP